MNTKNILTILGSPHDQNSNTRALVDDFVEEIALAGLSLEHRVISLGEMEVKPCIGCWSCTRGKQCPLSSQDDLDKIKAAMIDCDMLIVASPVYTNQITAQMKALFDRLFTWCHIFPLLGKYSLSACTTGNDGIKPVRNFLQMMLATYGTYSFGHIQSKGGFTPGYFPFREKARKKNRKLAQKVAETMKQCKTLPVSSIQRKMFSVMKDKMSGCNTFRYLADSDSKSDVVPSRIKLRVMRKILKKMNLGDKDIDRISLMMAFEYNWWAERNWFRARSFGQLADMPLPSGFDVRQRLLEH